MTIETVKARHEEALLRLPNVVGIGLGERRGQAVIKVLVTRKVPLSELSFTDRIPRYLDDYETDVESIGVPLPR